MFLLSKKRWSPMVTDRIGSSSVTKQKSSEDVFEWKEMAATGASAKKRLSSLASSDSKYPVTGTSTTSRTSEVPFLTGELEDRSIPPPDSVKPSMSLSSKPKPTCQSSNYCPSTTDEPFSEFAGDASHLDPCGSVSNDGDGDLCFNTRYPDLYFSTCIDI